MKKISLLFEYVYCVYKNDENPFLFFVKIEVQQPIFSGEELVSIAVHRDIRHMDREGDYS